MVEVNRIGNYGYYPQSTTFAGKRSEYRGSEDFQPGLIDPQAEEKAAKRKANILKAIGAVVVAAGAYVFLKKTSMGKNLLQKLKDLFKGSSKVAGNKTTVATSAAEETAAQVTKTKKVKVKPRKQVVAEHVDMPNKKVKMKNNGGKDAIHKVRRNKKQIIEATKLREEAEAFTTKDLDNFQKSLGTPATAEELVLIEKNNKAATNTLADIMEAKGIKRKKASNGRIVLEQTKPQTPKPAPAPKVEVSKAQQIADLQAQIAKQDEIIAKNSAPGMKRWAKPAEAEKAKLTAQLEVLQGKAPAPKPAVKPAPAPAPAPVITPKEKAAQVEQAWAEYNAQPTPTAPKAKVPTTNEIFAKAEAEAAQMAKEEAEVLEKMGITV